LRCSLADVDHADENADRVRRAIEACAALDAGVVSISLALPRAIDDCNLYRGMDHSRGSSRLATPADFEGTAERLHLLCTNAREANVKLSIEVHHASIADNGAATLRLHSLVSEPDVVGVNPDLVNSYWAYATPEEDWRDQLTWLAPLANIWHIKNVRRVVIEPGRRAEYLGTSLGDGDIDYRSAFAVMRDAGFCGWVSIERGGSGDALHLMAESLAYLQNLMNDLASGDNRHALQG
jgi:sugar phosphate isomerase/epimerase